MYLFPLFPLERGAGGGGAAIVECATKLGEKEKFNQLVVNASVYERGSEWKTERERETGNMLGNLIRLSAPQ